MNPFFQKLGYSASDRVVIIHADDVGMCQSSLEAYADLLDFGLVSSASTMVPCPWFPATARFCREHPAADMGVHLTLNCEWQDYRWGPLSTHDPASGLVDADGYCPLTLQELWANVNPAAALHEAQAQLARALQAGIDVTHLDVHMGAFSPPVMFPSVVDLALKNMLPPRHGRPDESLEEGNEWQQVRYATLLEAEAAGAPLFDFYQGLPLDAPNGQPELLRSILAQIPAGGLSLIVAHPAKDTPELRAIAPDWPSRVANYEAFSCPETLAFVRERGIHLIGFRPLRQAMRGAT